MAGKLESWRLETPGQDERTFLVEQEQAGETQAVVAGCVFRTWIALGGVGPWG